MPKAPAYVGIPGSGSATLRSNSAIPGGNTQTFDVDVTDVESITVFARARATATVGDLVINVLPFWADGTGLHSTNVPDSVVVAPSVQGANVEAMIASNLRGVKKVRLSIKNNAAGSLSFDLNYVIGF
jgi:hypothetical protein